MIDPREWQDIDARIAKAQNDERAARVRHIEDLTRDLRAEVRREAEEAREELGEMLAEVHKALETERAVRSAGDASLALTLDARTESSV